VGQHIIESTHFSAYIKCLRMLGNLLIDKFCL